MRDVGWLILAISQAYACAAIAPLLRRHLPGKLGAVFGWCCVPLALACPLWIPPDRVGLRAAAAFAAGELGFKMAEFFRLRGEPGRAIPLREYYRFLIPLPVLAASYPNHIRRSICREAAGPNLLRVFGGASGFVLAVLATTGMSGIPLLRSNFAWNHAAAMVAFLIAIESLSRAICGLERLAGFDTTPIIHNAYRSRTVAEFWRRYNSRIHDWLYRNVFLPSGGRTNPARSVLLTFLISGLLHELMFSLATSRVTGYQLAFFTIQGPAALASGPLERLARRGGIARKLVAHGSTILFLFVTSVLFFDGVRRIFPFIYASRSPLP